MQRLNGEIFKVKDAKIGVNFYPMHINCRSDCALLPKSMWPKNQTRNENKILRRKSEKR